MRVVKCISDADCNCEEDNPGPLGAQDGHQFELEECSSPSSAVYQVYKDTPFSLACNAQAAQSAGSSNPNSYNYEDIQWFYDDQLIQIRNGSNAELMNTVYYSRKVDQVVNMDGVHLIKGQLHFNMAKDLVGEYHCKIFETKSPKINLKGENTTYLHAFRVIP